MKEDEDLDEFFKHFMKINEEILDFKRVHNELAFSVFSELYFLENKKDISFIVGELRNPN